LRALRELIYYLPITTLEANAYIYKSGETAEKITFLLSGEVVVYVLITDFRIKAAQFYKTKAKHKRLSTQAVQTFIYALAHKNDRFIVEFEMDYLERGSVICHNLTLLNHPSFMSVKTMSTCTVATLSVSQLAAISANIPEIGQAINNYKALMRTNVAIHPVIKHHLGATDYHKWFGLNLGLEQGKRLWHAKMVLRKCVFGKLFERRENRRIGFSELPNLSQRLKAYMEVEKREDQLLTEKIRKSILHVDSQRLIDALELLELSEVGDPILSQLALEASIYRTHILTLAESMKELELTLMYLKKGISKTAGGVREVMKLVQFAVQLREYLAGGEVRGQAGMNIKRKAAY
jgi:CRP-like cAMP-binding protein